MKYSEYEKAFSPARLNKYLVACRGNTAKAMTLYRHNVKLCQKFYGILNIFEVVLRNAINAHYQRVLNDSDWVENQMRHGGMIENAPQKNEVLRIIATLRQKTFRNRIAHHEAICFDENGNLDMARTQSKYALILKYIDFLGYRSSHLFYGIDILPDSTITKIEALK